jgi:hypothetical protein
MRFFITILAYVVLASACTENSKKIVEIETPKLFVEKTSPSPLKSSANEQTVRLDERLPLDARLILEQADKFEIIALKPGIIFANQKVNQKTISAGRNWKFAITGKVKVNDATIKTELLNALYEGIGEAEHASMCFSPRHAIRAVSKGKTVELVICFECSNFSGSTPNGLISGAIASSPREVFNRVFDSAGLNLQN